MKGFQTKTTYVYSTMGFLDKFKFNKPTLGQKTGPQQLNLELNNLFGNGFGSVSNGSYDLYRKMRMNATVSIGLSFLQGLIASPKWNYQSKKNNDAPDGAVEYIQETLENLRPVLAKHGASAVTFGWSPFEKIWEKTTDGPTITKLRPLLPDKTLIRVNKDTGSFMGLEADLNTQGIFSTERKGTFLNPQKAFIHTLDQSPESGLYGRSKLESVIQAWTNFQKVTQKQGQHFDIITSAILLLEYVETGDEKDINGAAITGRQVVDNMVSAIKAGKPIAAPKTLHPRSADWMKKGITDPALLKSYNISFIESSSQAGATFLEAQKYYDAAILRGLGIGERSLIESSGGGTKAEAGTHSGQSIRMMEHIIEDFTNQITFFIVNDLLFNRYGKKAINTVQVTPEPIDNEKRNLLREIVRLLFSPQNAVITTELVNIDAILEQLGVPTSTQSRTENMAELIDMQKPQEQEILGNKDNNPNLDNGQPRVRGNEKV